MLARRIYRFALFGAAGGLAGSFLHQQILLDTLAGPLATRDRFFYLSLLGVMVGAAIGFAPRFAEGLGQFSFWRGARLGILGAALGAVGGMCTLPLAEWLHTRLHGGMSGRAAAWALLGLTIGFAEGLTGGARRWRGLLGGLLGGLLAGSLLEALLANQGTHSDSGIIALITIGLMISLCVALFVNVLSEAWLEGLPGSKVEGQIYHLSKFKGGHEAILGSGKKGGLLVWIPDAEPQHAAITLRTDAAILRNLAEMTPTRLDGIPVTEEILRDGQIISLGSASLRYRERRRALRVGAPAATANS